MKVTRDKTENSQVFLTIEMESAEVEAALAKSYSRLVKRTNIPGFRKGKAPRQILERHVGKEALLEDAIDNLIPEACEDAIKEQNIEVFARPQIEITQTDPLIFKATVPVEPSVGLGDYHQIQLTPQPVEMGENDVDEAIEHLRHHYTTWEPVERKVRFDDLVVLDIESSTGDDPYINQQGAQYQVLKDTPSPAPGFAEQLVGMKLDEEKEFKLQFPADYAKSELAEKEAAFKVKVIEIKQERLPELNDEFAKQVDPELEAMDALRERVSDNLRLRAEEKARADFEEQVVEAVVGQAQVEFPPVLVDMEIGRMLEEQSRRWQAGGQSLEEYLGAVNKTEEELKEELRPVAEKRVTRSLVLGKVTEEEKIEVSDSEIDAEIENLTKGNAEKKDEVEKFFNTPQSRESIKRWLTGQKTVKRLVEIAEASTEEEG